MHPLEENLVVRFIRRSASFGSVLFGVKLLNFLFLFLFWRILDPADFGTVAVAQGLSMVLAPGLNFGLSNSISRLYKDYSKRGEEKDLVGSAFLLSTAGALVFCLLFATFGSHAASLLFPEIPFSPYLEVSTWSAFFLSICLFGEQVIRVTDRLKLNAAFVISEFTLKNGVILAVLFAVDDLAYGYILGEMIALGFLASAYAAACARGARFRLSWKFLGEPVKLALPIVPTGVLSQLNSTLDRFVLVNYIQRAELGLYSQALRVGAVLDIMTRALKTVWFPTLLRSEQGAPENLDLLRKSYLFTFDFLAVIVLGMSLPGVALIRLVAPPDYHAMGAMLAPVALILLVKNYAFLPSMRLLATRFAMATLIAMVVTFAAAAGMHALFTVRFGIAGALVAVGVTHLFTYFSNEALAFKECPAGLPWFELGVRFILLSCATAIAALLALLDPAPWVMAAQACAFLAFTAPVALFYWRKRAKYMDAGGREAA